jgi:hypothetical protein
MGPGVILAPAPQENIFLYTREFIKTLRSLEVVTKLSAYRVGLAMGCRKKVNPH